MSCLMDYFTINLKGIQLTLPTIKLIRIIQHSDVKKDIMIDDNKLTNISKAGKNKHESVRKNGKKNLK